jgi:hypothetical protein
LPAKNEGLGVAMQTQITALDPVFSPISKSVIVNHSGRSFGVKGTVLGAVVIVLLFGRNAEKWYGLNAWLFKNM